MGEALVGKFRGKCAIKAIRQLCSDIEASAAAMEVDLEAWGRVLQLRYVGNLSYADISGIVNREFPGYGMSPPKISRYLKKLNRNHGGGE